MCWFELFRSFFEYVPWISEPFRVKKWQYAPPHTGPVRHSNRAMALGPEPPGFFDQIQISQKYF